MGKDLRALHSPVNWHHIRQGKKRVRVRKSLSKSLLFSVMPRHTVFIISSFSSVRLDGAGNEQVLPLLG